MPTQVWVQLSQPHHSDTGPNRPINTPPHDPAPKSHMPMGFSNTIIDPKNGQSLEYRQLICLEKRRHVWTKYSANTFSFLAQGIGFRVKVTYCINFIRCTQVPKGNKIAYGIFLVRCRLHKQEQERTNPTVGGNLLDTDTECSAPTADTTTTKMLLNSTIYTLWVHFMTTNIKKYYIMIPFEGTKNTNVYVTQSILSHRKSSTSTVWWTL